MLTLLSLSDIQTCAFMIKPQTFSARRIIHVALANRVGGCLTLQNYSLVPFASRVTATDSQ